MFFLKCHDILSIAVFVIIKSTLSRTLATLRNGAAPLLLVLQLSVFRERFFSFSFCFSPSPLLVVVSRLSWNTSLSLSLFLHHSFHISLGLRGDLLNVADVSTIVSTSVRAHATVVHQWLSSSSSISSSSSYRDGLGCVIASAPSNI